MGPKITIDSATMMNKGLEVIEAHYLFGTDYDNIDVVVHPQSIVHSLIELVDGSMIAQLGPTDMRIPIQYALTYPRRRPAPAGTINLVDLGSLDFEAPANDVFPCLSYAYQAGRDGGTAPAVLNAANETAVAAFLDGRSSFTDISDCVEEVLNSHTIVPVETVEDLEEAERWARERAVSWLSAWGSGQ
jgi:1-deoxy-D-xylulose-5-phosphate reductoisomerase